MSEENRFDRSIIADILIGVHSFAATRTHAYTNAEIDERKTGQLPTCVVRTDSAVADGM